VDEAASAPARALNGTTVVRVVAYVPLEVVQWADKKALAVYKSRSRFVSDLLIRLYRSDKPA
jgi:hypothetical protein